MERGVRYSRKEDWKSSGRMRWLGLKRSACAGQLALACADVSGERCKLTSTLGVFSVWMNRVLLDTTGCCVRDSVARPGRLAAADSAEIERAELEVNVHVLVAARGST